MSRAGSGLLISMHGMSVEARGPENKQLLWSKTMNTSTLQIREERRGEEEKEI